MTLVRRGNTELPTAEEDERINAEIAVDSDNPEWTKEAFARSLPAVKFFSPEMYAVLCTQRMRDPKNKPHKVPATIRFDVDLLTCWPHSKTVDVAGKPK